MSSEDDGDRPIDAEAAAVAGSTESPDEPEREKSDIEVFAEANEEFQETLAELDPDAPGFAAEQMKAIDTFLRTVAKSDPGEMVVDQAAAIVAENTDQTKKTARRELNNYQRERERAERDRPELTEIIRGSVDRVEALASTETDGDVRFRFVFGNDSSVVVDDETLWSATAIRRAFASVFERVPVFDPPEGESWEDVVDEIYADLLVWKRDEVGPRMQVIERIREHIEKHAAYTDRQRAYTDSGVWVNKPDADVVWIESSRVEEKAKEKDETLEGLRWELDDKGLRKGSSQRMRVGSDKNKSWWPLDRSAFEPKRVEVPEDDEEGGDGGE